LNPTQAGEVLHRAIFALDVFQVVAGCGSLVCNINGRVPDEGAVAEAAMAWTLGKPVVLFKQDIRTTVSSRDNPLVAGLTEFAIASEFEELIDSLHRQIDQCEAPPGRASVLPPRVRKTVTAGEALWNGIVELADSPNNAALAELVLELFGPTRSGGIVVA
jgi:hypothetical protein